MRRKGKGIIVEDLTLNKSCQGEAMRVREYNDQDLKEIIRIWNEVVEEGIAFPREDTLDMESGFDRSAVRCRPHRPR